MDIVRALLGRLSQQAGISPPEVEKKRKKSFRKKRDAAKGATLQTGPLSRSPALHHVADARLGAHQGGASR
jgi:hypothetical protein